MRSDRPADPDNLLRRITDQLDAARRDVSMAAGEVEMLRQELAAELTRLPDFLWNNVRRRLRKSPETIDALDDLRMDDLRAELEPVFQSETVRIQREIQDDTSWHDPAVSFITDHHSLWKSIKAAEAAVNRVMRKFNLPAASVESWTWLSEKCRDITQGLFPDSKKRLTDHVKRVQYLESRLEEEENYERVMRRLDATTKDEGA